MVDSRFFHHHGPLSLQVLAEIGECTLQDHRFADVTVKNVATLQDATEHDIAFLSNEKYIHQLSQTKATACILHKNHIGKAPKELACLVAENPYYSYAKIAASLFPEHTPNDGHISEHAVIDASAHIGKDCTVEPLAYIGPDAVIGDHCHIARHTSIGKGVILGNHCHIHANVSITHSIIGQHVTVHSGARIGQDGFGFATTQNGEHVTVPQLGRVVIGDRVNIGANSCIDRGSTTDTIIGDGCRIDNLVQIAHNVQMGKGCIIVSQVGISGSTKLGNFVVLGGQVGMAGHLNIEDGAQVTAKSGVMTDIPSKTTYGGIPAVPVKDWHRMTIALRKLIRKGKK